MQEFLHLLVSVILTLFYHLFLGFEQGEPEGVRLTRVSRGFDLVQGLVVQFEGSLLLLFLEDFILIRWSLFHYLSDL